MRGFILLLMLILIIFNLWHPAAILALWLLADFIYRTVKMYRWYRDSCTLYYVVFFTLWSLESLVILYGLCRGLRCRLSRILKGARSERR